MGHDNTRASSHATRSTAIQYYRFERRDEFGRRLNRFTSSSSGATSRSAFSRRVELVSLANGCTDCSRHDTRPATRPPELRTRRFDDTRPFGCASGGVAAHTKRAGTVLSSAGGMATGAFPRSDVLANIWESANTTLGRREYFA